jgi:hypothetical protein
MPQCPRCQDVGWVCENHPGRAWAKDKPNGCECGAGAPCPDCNEVVDDGPPRSKGVVVSINAVRGKGRLN